MRTTIKHLISETKLLLEMQMRGEWWIDDSGSAMFVDGDIGDMNHSAYVVDMVSRELLDMLGIDSNDEYVSLEEWFENIYEIISDDWSEKDQRAWDEGYQYALIQIYLENKFGVEYNGVPISKMLEVSQDTIMMEGDIDPRDYAMQYLHWIRVINNIAQVWELNRTILKNMSNGLWDAYSDELDGYDEQIEEDQPTFDIESLKTGTLYEDVPFGIIDSANVSGLNAYRNRYRR